MKPVLYAEDSLAAQALMRRFLKQTCELTMATTIEAAEELVEKNKYALVIADFLFPEGDAMDFIVGLRKRWGPKELPIVVVSSAMDRVLLTRVLRAGANEGLAKPVDPAAMCELVERMLTDPFVRALEHGVIGVCCFQWEAGGRHFQYCPEIQWTASGETREAAAKAMLDELTRRLAEGANLGETKNESMVTHIVPF